MPPWPRAFGIVRSGSDHRVSCVLRFQEGFTGGPLGPIRCFLHWCWWLNVTQGLFKFLWAWPATPDKAQDIGVGWDCLLKVSLSDWCHSQELFMCSQCSEQDPYLQKQVQGKLNSPSLQLFHLIQLCTGSKIIAQRIGSKSRGVMSGVIFSSFNISHFIPLQLSAHERNSAMLAWIQFWRPRPVIRP